VPRPTLKLGISLTVLLALALCVGCATSNNGETAGLYHDNPMSALDAEWQIQPYEEFKKGIREEYEFLRTHPFVNELGDEYPYVLPDPLPDVKFIRYITEVDHIDTMVSCLRDEGIVVDYVQGSDRYGTDYQNGRALAEYICTLKYPPLSPEYFPRKNVEQLYEYSVTFLKPCYENIGYTISDPPTLERYLDVTYLPHGDQIGENELWQPSEEIKVGDYFDSTKPAGQKFLEARLECPQYPENFFPEIPEP
jgi:hypothetical protein